MADRSYRGNVSELITQIAQQAARQEAAGERLRSHGRAPMTAQEVAAFERAVAAELAGQGRAKRGRRRAA